MTFGNLAHSILEKIYPHKTLNVGDFKKMNDIIEEKSVLVPLYYDEVYRFYSNDLSDFKTNSFNALLLKEAKKNIK